MANDKKNINPLVAADDDPTAELETLVLPDEHPDDDTEASATTTGYAQHRANARPGTVAISELKSEVVSRSETIDKLQFDLEVLRAKWQGLATEIDARKEHANRLDSEIAKTKQELQRSEECIAEKDDQISRLEASVENRDESYRKLTEELAKVHQDIAAAGPDKLQQAERLLAIQTGQLASVDLENRELKSRLTRTEEYADQVGYQFRLKDAEADKLGRHVEVIERQLSSALEQLTTLRTELDVERKNNADLESCITVLHDTHADEIRMIRFELGDAQETLTQHELVAEQLASDLVQTRGRSEQLESKLAETEEHSQSRIETLETENQRLRTEAESMTEKLQTKSEAINCLLAELAKAPQQADPVADIDEAIQETDEQISELTDDNAHIERDRVTRLLVGHFDGQELRFPLFKDRLTIGRTHQNDIQLKSEHVSRRHAVIVIEGEVTRVIDWGSKNGVYVNSRRIKEHFLKNGDIVGVSAAEFRYEERPKRDG